MNEQAGNDRNQLKTYWDGSATTLQVQSVLYNMDLESIDRALVSTVRAVEISVRAGVLVSAIVSYGDCSPQPCITADQLAELRKKCGDLVSLEYHFFDANQGSAKGHNLLAMNTVADFVIIQNPDVVVSPETIINLFEPFKTPNVGMVEAKQLPIEHPKEYDRKTGETSWASTACALIPASLYKELLGFDQASFFLYCDDVDFSWRVRLAGHLVIYQPAAFVFHDKRLSNTGRWTTTSSEVYYSAEAALILSYKWSRPDVCEAILRMFKAAGEEAHQKAAAEFEKRKANGSLPKQVDAEHRIAQFIDGNYAQHRYSL